MLSFLNVADVVAQLLGQLPLVLALLHVRAVETLHVALIEHRRHRLDGLELGLDLIEQRRLEHAGRPAPPRRQLSSKMSQPPKTMSSSAASGTKSADQRRPAFGALAEADRAHLRERADGLGQPFAYCKNAGNRRGADRAEADEKNA